MLKLLNRQPFLLHLWYQWSYNTNDHMLIRRVIDPYLGSLLNQLWVVDVSNVNHRYDDDYYIEHKYPKIVVPYDSLITKLITSLGLLTSTITLNQGGCEGIDICGTQALTSIHWWHNLGLSLSTQVYNIKTLKHPRWFYNEKGFTLNIGNTNKTMIFNICPPIHEGKLKYWTPMLI